MKDFNGRQRESMRNRTRMPGAGCGGGRGQGMYRQNFGNCRRGNLDMNGGPSGIPASEPVTGEQPRSRGTSLEMLREQAARLSQALKEVESQIEALGGK